MYNTQEQERKILNTLTDKPKKPKKKTEKQIFYLGNTKKKSGKCGKKNCVCNL